MKKNSRNVSTADRIRRYMSMRIPEICARCLYDRQAERSDNAQYLSEIKELIDNRSEDDTTAYMVYLFKHVHEKYYGAGLDYTDIKKQFNDLLLGMEESLRNEIAGAPDPLERSIAMARIGNYIDFGAMNHVDQAEFLELFHDIEFSDNDKKTYDSFLRECARGERFLLICDNCGEIVLDKLMLEQVKARFPHLTIKALVRGGDVLNDATVEDAEYTGLDRVAQIVSNGEAIAGTVYKMLPDDAKRALDEADVILSKGQANYESLSGQGIHAFYAFLCKCDYFSYKFHVPRLTGMFIEEME